MNEIFDLIIVGGGPSGLTAAIYATRRKMKTLIIAKSVGGQAAITSDIENYPGFEFTSGPQLMMSFQKQAEKWGAKLISNEVKKIYQQGEEFIVETNKDSFHAKSVILAFGLTPRDLNVPGEEQLKGRGVTYCATCDGPLYKNKVVGVVGGGNSALEAALYLSQIASKVYLIHFSEKFSGDKVMLEKIYIQENIEFKCCERIKELKGETKLESAILFNVLQDGTETELKMDGIFIEIGYQAKTDWLENFVELNSRHEIVTNKNCETSVPGVFAAGDCSDINYKQIIIAAGEGAKAALAAYKHVIAKGGGSIPDWGNWDKAKKN